MSETTYTYIVGRGQVGGGVFNPVVLSEIVLPNGLSYEFTYNIYGEIEKVTYPTGAYQRYQHSGIPPLTHTAVPFNQGSRGIISRWVSPNGTGGADESQWLYQVAGPPLPDSGDGPGCLRRSEWHAHRDVPAC